MDKLTEKGSVRYVIELTQEELKTVWYLVSNMLPEEQELLKKIRDPNRKEHNVFDVARTKENYPHSRQVQAGLNPIGDLEPWTDKSSTPGLDQLARVYQDLEDPMAYSEGHKSSLRFTRLLMNLIKRQQETIEQQQVLIDNLTESMEERDGR